MGETRRRVAGDPRRRVVCPCGAELWDDEFCSCATYSDFVLVKQPTDDEIIAALRDLAAELRKSQLVEGPSLTAEDIWELLEDES